MNYVPMAHGLTNSDEETDIREIIKEIICIGNEITFVSNIRSYQFDISKVNKDEINELWTIIGRINFDNSIKMNRRGKIMPNKSHCVSCKSSIC
jgi:uncharacterized protein (DUF1015 family)